MDLFKVTVSDDGEIKTGINDDEFKKYIAVSTTKNANGTIGLVLRIDKNGIDREMEKAKANLEKQAKNFEAKAKAAKSKQD